MPTGSLFDHEPAGVVRRTSWFWTDSFKGAICRGMNCHARITFATNCITGKLMPFTGRPTPIRTEMRPGIHGRMRQAAELDLAEAHPGTCPDADRFMRRAKGKR